MAITCTDSYVRCGSKRRKISVRGSFACSCSCSIDFEIDDRFDGLYMNVANQAHGIEPLLDSVFSFLRRRSDFFSGPPGLSSSSSSTSSSSSGDVGKDAGTEAAISTVHKVLRKHVDIYLRDKRKKEEEAAAKKGKRKRKRS